MTQTAIRDLGAMALKAPASTQSNRKPQSDFQASLEQAGAQARDAVRSRDDKRTDNTRPDRDRPADNAQAQAPTPPVPNEQAKADAPAPEAPPTPQASDAPVVKPQDDSAAQAEAQALVALMLATGAQVTPKEQTASPVPASSQDAQAAVQAASPQTAPAEEAAPQAQVPQAAQAALSAKAQAETAPSAQAAQAATQPTTQVASQAQAAALQSQAQGLGRIALAQEAKAQTGEAVKLGPSQEAQPQGSTNLLLALMEEAPEANTQGSTTPAMVLDDAAGIEMPSPLVSAFADEPQAVEEDADAPSPPPLLNGENRQAADVKEGARAQEASRPAKAEDVLPQILKQAEVLRASQQNSVKLQLYPENLGKMEIKVSSHQGVLSAQFTADNQHVKSLLEGHVASLQRSLADMGIKVDKVEVTIASTNLNFDAYGQSPQHGGEMPERQNRQPSSFVPEGTYGFWRGEERRDEGAYARMDHTAIDYVA